MTIQSWGFFVALGLLVAILVGISEAKRKKIDSEVFLNVSLIMIVSGIVGARIFYVLLFFRDFQLRPYSIVEFWNGGMVFYGGFIAGVFFGTLYLMWKKVSVLSFFDTLAVVFPLGYAVGRIGCHLIRDHMGKVTTVPWGFEVSPGVIRHDTAIYSIFTGIVLYTIVWSLRKKILTPGVTTILVVFLYSVARFITDAFRATDLPQSDPRYFGLTVSQGISLLGFAVSGGMLLWHRVQLSKKVQQKSIT